MRSIWSGAISFGLIYIPVKLYNASESEELDLTMLRKSDLSRIRFVRVSSETGEEVPWDQIVKGYEYKKGSYVVIDDEDFKRANVKKTQTIEIVSFVDQAEIDSKFLEKPYFLEPVKDAKKVYTLLLEALKQTGKVGVARYVMRTREHMAILKPEDNAIVLNQMRFASEIRRPDKLELPENGSVPERELAMAIKLIDQLTEPWNPEQYRDSYTEDLKRIVQEKIEGRVAELREEEPAPTEVTDLFDKLTESLKVAGKKREMAKAPEPKKKAVRAKKAA